MKIMMVGHSTVLMDIAGHSLLTDPYLGRRGNPAYARVAPPAETAEKLNAVDLVLVSHNHWDHTDRRFFRLLAPSVPVLAPRGSAWVTRAKGAKNVTGLGKWEQKEFGAIRVTAVPALHIALTRGFVIEGENKSVYFAGDTYYGKFMKEIGRRFKLDLAFLPVTTFRIPMTMGERDAVKAARDLSPKLVIPIHLGIQPRSALLRTRETPEGFAQCVRAVGLTCEVKILREGQSWES